MLRNTLLLGAQKDIFASTTPIYLRAEFVWSQFRQEIREIYATKTGFGARHDKAVDRKKKAGKKVVGRKEKEKSSQQESQDFPTPAMSTQVSQSSTSLRYISHRSTLLNTINTINTTLNANLNTSLHNRNVYNTNFWSNNTRPPSDIPKLNSEREYRFCGWWSSSLFQGNSNSQYGSSVYVSCNANLEYFCFPGNITFRTGIGVTMGRVCHNPS